MTDPAQHSIILIQGKDLLLEFTVGDAVLSTDTFRGKIRKSFLPNETGEIATGVVQVPLAIAWSAPNLSIGLASSITQTLIPNCNYSDLRTATVFDDGVESLPIVNSAYYRTLPLGKLAKQFPDYYALEVEWLQGAVVNPFLFGGVLVPGEVER